MGSKFVLGDTWQEVTEGDRVGDVVPKDAISEGDQVDIGPVFMVRVITLTTAPQRVDAGIVARYVDVFSDVDVSDVYEMIVQVGQSVDESSAIIIEPHSSVKLPMQRQRSISLKMISGTAKAYIVFNSEPFPIWRR